MLKKTIKFKSFADDDLEETFFFNLTEAEATTWELSLAGGLSGMLEKVMEGKDVPKIIEFFEEFIMRSYGEISPNKKRFIKSDALSLEFSQTDAYNKLFIALLTEEGFAADFVNGIIPAVPDALKGSEPAKE